MQRLLSLILIAVLCLVGACKDGIGPDLNEAGTYELVSIDGRSLPTAFFSVEVLSGSIVLKEDRTYQAQSTVQGKDNLGQIVRQTHTESGTYTRTDNTLQFTSTAGDETIATYGGRTITVEEGMVLMVYQRE